MSRAWAKPVIWRAFATVHATRSEQMNCWAAPWRTRNEASRPRTPQQGCALTTGPRFDAGAQRPTGARARPRAPVERPVARCSVRSGDHTRRRGSHMLRTSAPHGPSRRLRHDSLSGTPTPLTPRPRRSVLVRRAAHPTRDRSSKPTSDTMGRAPRRRCTRTSPACSSFLSPRYTAVRSSPRSEQNRRRILNERPRSSPHCIARAIAT